jgi:hypothetical protein
MKKQISILICLLFLTVGNSQETKEVKNSIGEKNELFNVLKSDQKIKQGKYVLNWNWKFYHSISEEGQFLNNEKQGVWNEYYRFRGKYNENDMRVKYRTTYANDKKNGLFIEFSYDKDTLQVGSFKANEKVEIWKKFEDGKLVEHYDYLNNKSLLVPKNVQNEKVDVLPKMIEGDLNSFLIKNLNPINHKKKKNLLGNIEITMLITKEGLAQDVEISGADYTELENEFKVALSNSSGNWEPAIRNGEKVDVTVIIPTKFLIEWKRKKFRVGMNCGSMKQAK